jgi:TonB family protein
MRFLLSALFSLVVCCGATADDDAAARAEFLAAYNAYQELVAQDRPADALPFAERAYVLGQQVYGPDDRNTAALAINYGKCLVSTGEWERARTMIQSAVEIYEGKYDKDAPELIDSLMELGHASAEYAGSAQQQRIYARALQIAAANDGDESLLYARLSLEAGSRILLLSSTDNGLPYMKKALAIFEKSPEANRDWIARAEFTIGKHYLSAGRLRNAEEHFLKALQAFEDQERPADKLQLSTHAFLVEVYERQKQRDAATRHCLAIGRMVPFSPTQEPEPLFRRYPEYPQRDLRRGNEGWVQVGFVLDDSGMVRNPTVIDSTVSEGMNRAALDAIKDWRYAPRFENGSPVTTTGVQTIIKFQIQL